MIRISHYKPSLTWGKLAPATIYRGQATHRQAECKLGVFKDPHWLQGASTPSNHAWFTRSGYF
ncbi:hypothetical protein [Kitasatospora aureofaciens]|uniref:hypothetical protein n=1 Tax=Kitasatospora aureofaciens TaxID=1894 RepID=UPI0036F474C7